MHHNDQPSNKLVWNCGVVPISQLPELDIPIRTKRQTGKGTCIQTKQPYFNKMSALVGTIVNTTWFSHYPSSQYIINNNGSEFKLHFETLCDSYQYQEPRSKHNTKAGASNNHGNALPSWNWHGQNNHWEWHCWLSHQCSMGHLLYLTQYLKPHQVQQVLDGMCCLMAHAWLTGQKSGNIDNKTQTTT